MSELLTRQAEIYGSETALRFLSETGEEPELSFEDLDAGARSIAAGLAGYVRPGDRVLLVFPPGLEFLTAFFGCLYAGVVAVPTTYPKPRRPLPRMSRIAQDSGATFAITTAHTRDTIDPELLDDAVRSITWLAVEELLDAEPLAAPYSASPEDLAFLQYTSGSTAEPKGVMVSHGNLLANLEAIRVAFGMSQGPIEDEHRMGVFWLPAYHDMGLIGGLLTPLYVGGCSVLMAPTSFLKRPIAWLEACSRFRATISGAPNFAYDLCVQKSTAEQRAKLDLSAWKLAFCGAEPVRPATLREFANAFEPAGFDASAFYPCYGLAESTLLAAGPDHTAGVRIASFDRAALAQGEAVPVDRQGSLEVEGVQDLVSCGAPPLGHSLMIACHDPETGALLGQAGAGEVGEVLVRGPSVAQGYWKLPELSRATFGVSVPGVTGSYLRTGDLGFLHEGELFVTGRLKDLIIVRGRNLYPQDIEQTGELAHPAVLTGAAFGVELEGREELVLVFQVDRNCDADERPRVAEAVRREVASQHSLEPAEVVLIRHGSLPITSSGKVQRSVCRDRYLAGELKTLYAWRRQPVVSTNPAPCLPDVRSSVLEGVFGIDHAAQRIEGWMIGWLVQNAGVSADDAKGDRPFAELGIDSMTAVELSSELEKQFAVPLPPIVAWNYPTPVALSRYLAEQALGADEAPAPAPAPLEFLSTSAPSAETPEEQATLEALLAEIEGLSEDEAARLAGDTQPGA